VTSAGLVTPAAPPTGPLFVFRRAPGELATVGTRDELRGALFDDLLAGGAAWLSAGALAPADAGHAALLRAARRFRAGLAGLDGNPHTAVLDWSTLRGPADVAVLAGAPVLESAVTRRGALVVSCEPRDAALAAQLGVAGMARFGGRWVGERGGDDRLGHVSLARLRPPPGLLASGRRGQGAVVGAERWDAGAVRLLGPVAVADPRDVDGAGDAVAEFARVAESEAAEWYLGEGFASLVWAVASEVGINAVKHASATRVGMAAAVRRDAGGPWLDLAVVDDGVGIAATARVVRGVPALAAVPERHFVADVLHGALEPAPRGGGGAAGARRRGRATVDHLRTLFAWCPARVVVRSGGVLAALDRTGFRVSVVASASAGLGTVVRVAVPLFRGPVGVGARPVR
jgi:hypothetical protein